MICAPLMLIPKPIILYFFTKTEHEILNERLSTHEASGIELQGIRPTDGSKKSIGTPVDLVGKYSNKLNDSMEEEQIDTVQKKNWSKINLDGAVDTQEHMSLKASHTLRASLEGREPDEFITLIREGLG